MFTVSRNVLLAAIAVSVLAGCKTTSPRECDRLKPGVTYNGKMLRHRRALPRRQGRHAGQAGKYTRSRAAMI
jgi:hypothetical protein